MPINTFGKTIIITIAIIHQQIAHVQSQYFLVYYFNSSTYIS